MRCSAAAASSHRLAPLLALLGALWLALGQAAPAHAGEDDDAAAREAHDDDDDDAGPFERAWGLSSYLSTWQGDYASIGLGGRLRLEPLSWLGLEVFAEAFLVDWPGSIRHDYPIGFNLYAPWALTDWLRLRPLFGMCAVFSFIEPGEAHAPRADDVLFGVHAGGGLELGVSSHWSVFFDAKAQWYLGHDRAVDGWIQRVDDEISQSTVAQLSLGLQLHL